MSATYVIGDVHGCHEELSELLDMIGPKIADRFIFCGDLIDRGPSVANVLKVVKDLKKRSNVDILRGNHEYKHERYEHSSSMKVDDDFISHHMELTDEDKGILFGLPNFIKGDGFVVVHAGIPYWQNLPMETHLRFDSGKPLNLEEAKKSSILFFLRAEGPDRRPTVHGKPISPGTYFWAEKYDGKHGFCYFGHEVFLDKSPRLFPNAMGLDTGCVFGGLLSAVRLAEDGTPDESFSVSAKKEYVKYDMNVLNGSSWRMALNNKVQNAKQI